jgi:hypothetical protein
LRRVRRRWPLLAVGITLTLAACGGGGGTTSQPAAATTTPATAPATTATASAQASPTTTAPAPTTQPRTTTQAPTTTAQTTTSPSAQAQPAATTPAQPEPKPKPAGRPIDETARVTLVSSPRPGQYLQHGTVTGTFDGQMELQAKITNRGVEVQFSAVLDGGTVVGTGLAIPQIGDSPLATLHGTAAITGGTGKFAGAHARGLQVSGKAAMNGSRATVRMVGTVAF